jgi:hypothetical protein
MFLSSYRENVCKGGSFRQTKFCEISRKFANFRSIFVEFRENEKTRCAGPAIS